MQCEECKHFYKKIELKKQRNVFKWGKNEKLHSSVPKIMKELNNNLHRLYLFPVVFTDCSVVKLSISFIKVRKVIHSLKSWILLKLRLRWHLSRGNANFIRRSMKQFVCHPRIILTCSDNTSGGACRSGHQHSPHAASYIPADFSTWGRNRSAGWVGDLLIIKQQDSSMPWWVCILGSAQRSHGNGREEAPAEEDAGGVYERGNTSDGVTG